MSGYQVDNMLINEALKALCVNYTTFYVMSTTIVFYYRPQTKFAKAMFLHLSVSHSVNRGVCLSACWDPPRSRHPPRAVHAGRYSQQAGGTHPTGMQSCFLILVKLTINSC